MNETQHIIKSKVFEVSFNLEKEGIDFQKKLSELIREELAQVTEACLNEYNSKDRKYIHRIEIDLGRFNYPGFELELPRVYEKELRKALDKKLSRESVQSEEAPEYELGLVSMVRYFLIKSYMPWNYSAGHWNSFSELFEEAMRSDAVALVDDLNLLLRSEPARVRLVNHIKEKQIKHLISKVEPTQADLIKDYHEEWLKTQKRKLIFKTDKSELSKQLWLFILNYLY